MIDIYIEIIELLFAHNLMALYKQSFQSYMLLWLDLYIACKYQHTKGNIIKKWYLSSITVSPWDSQYLHILHSSKMFSYLPLSISYLCEDTLNFVSATRYLKITTKSRYFSGSNMDLYVQYMLNLLKLRILRCQSWLSQSLDLTKNSFKKDTLSPTPCCIHTAPKP